MNIEYFKKAILFKKQTFASVKMPELIGRLNAYFKSNPKLVVPEESALLFYMLNNAFGELCIKYDAKEELPEQAELLARRYLNSASESSARLFYYILLIMTREARHLYSKDSIYNTLESLYGVQFKDFISKLKHKNSSSAVEFLRTEGASLLSDMSVEKYAEGITYLFNNGGFSGGYGGKPWGNIANTIRKSLAGETSLEIMNDTAWTLAHNGGPMFNKGMLYEHFGSGLYKILDVQRSGQIRELVAENVSLYPHSVLTGVTSDVVTSFKLIESVFPSDDDLYVDWFKVEALGSLNKYPNEKNNQLKKFGPPLTSTACPNKIYVDDCSYATVIERKAA